MMSDISSVQAQRPKAGQDCEDSRTARLDCRTVMMKDSEVPRCRVLVALLSIEDSNDTQKRMHAVVTIHPTLAYHFTYSTPISPCLAQRGSDNRGSTVLNGCFWLHWNRIGSYPCICHPLVMSVIMCCANSIYACTLLFLYIQPKSRAHKVGEFSATYTMTYYVCYLEGVYQKWNF